MGPVANKATGKPNGDPNSRNYLGDGDGTGQWKRAWRFEGGYSSERKKKY